MIHGFLNIDKPPGLTSHDVVAQVRRLVHQKRVGHAGTLDPAATGVLIVALGAATRLIEYVQEATTKRYLATIHLGISTDTDDAEGAAIETRDVPPLDQAAIEQALAAFRGPIMQVPPMYAALHHNGQRLHELARAGITVERAARPVQIDLLELIAWEPPLISVDVICSKGTYIRSLARDLGAALGCGAHLQSLRRTAVGAFTIEHAVPLDRLMIEGDAFSRALMPPDLAVDSWPAITVDEQTARQIRNGLPIAPAGVSGDNIRAHGPDGALLALLTREQTQWKPVKVFDWSI